jgi:ADP-heptose:LPS heptosyltransferase
MNKRQKIAIDRFMGYGLALLVRIPAITLEKVLKRDHSMPPKESPQRIVVAKYLGIGSILQATPMLKGLKDKYPSSKLTFISLKSNKELLSNYDFIDEVLCVDDTSIFQVAITTFHVIIRLIKNKTDLFIDLEVHSTYGSLVCLLSCAKNRLGFSMQDEDHRTFLYTHLLYLNTNFPIRYCYMQLAQLAGVKIGVSSYQPLSPELSSITVDFVSRHVKEIFDYNHKGIIVINSNASDLRYERRWNRESFAIVAEHFAQQGYAVALVGAASEYEYVQGIIQALGPKAKRVHNIAGVFSLLQFFAFLAQSKLIITNDSGIMNMSLTLPVPQLLLAGPVNPEQYFIPNEFRTYIYYQTYCSPCTHYIDKPPCAGDNVCMQQIQTKEVIDIGERLLLGETVKPKRRISLSYNSEVLGILKFKGKIVGEYNKGKC